MTSSFAQQGMHGGSLDRYHEQIRETRLLTAEEERTLARRYQAKGGDVAAGEALVASQLRLVAKIAREYGRDPQTLADLEQEGNVGLLLALRKFDPERGLRLSTYAAWWIRAYILKHVLDTARLVRVGTTGAQRKLFFGLRREKEKLAAAGEELTVATIAKAMGVEESEVIEMETRMSRRDLSLDAPLDHDGEDARTGFDLLSSPDEERPDRAVEARQVKAQLHHRLEEFAATLDGRERDLYRRRLIAEQPQTLEQLGARHGISRERERQIEQRLVERLKQYLVANDVDALAA